MPTSIENRLRRDMQWLLLALGVAIPLQALANSSGELPAGPRDVAEPGLGHGVDGPLAMLRDPRKTDVWMRLAGCWSRRVAFFRYRSS